MKKIFKHIVVWMLTLEARLALLRHKPKIIAVTGNVGKTSTKDAVYAVVTRAYGASRVRKSEKSMNSEIGLPLAILGLENAWSSASGWIRNIKEGFIVALFALSGREEKRFPKWLVLEVGADHPGDIRRVASWLRPDIAVLTRMSDVPVHVEFFKDAAEVLREKMYLAQAVKAGGTIVVNADDPHFAEPVAALSAKKIFYGAAKNADARIVGSEILYDESKLPLPVGQKTTIKMGETEAVLTLYGVVGEHLAYPLAAACGVAVALGLESVVPNAFKGFESPKGRMHILKGRDSSVIIDDSYNSSPLACAEALKTMAKLSIRGRKIAALGDMKELGDNVEKAHRDIGALAAETLHTLVTVGSMSRLMAEAALAAGMAPDRVMSLDASEQAAAALVDIVRPGDAVLVKGSQSMRMERVSKALLAEPTLAPELLVRQEREWETR